MADQAAEPVGGGVGVAGTTTTTSAAVDGIVYPKYDQDEGEFIYIYILYITELFFQFLPSSVLSFPFLYKRLANFLALLRTYLSNIFLCPGYYHQTQQNKTKQKPLHLFCSSTRFSLKCSSD